MSIKSRLARLEHARASASDRIEVIDTSGLAPWTRDVWPPWRHPDKHPIPPGFEGDGVPEPERSQPLGGTPDDQ
jgi:hypothetical protein